MKERGIGLPEWRKDPLSGRWVAIATERSKRPSDFKMTQNGPKAQSCALCPGREQDTPPEVLAYRKSDSAGNRPGWWVRVIPNKFPAVKIEASDVVRECAPYRYMDGVGAHEVVVEAPDHGRALEDLPENQVSEVIRAWRDRSLDLRRDRRFKYIQVFKNFGAAAGASLEHPHSQIIAMPMVPPEVSGKMKNLISYAAATGHCIMCEILRRELLEKNRVVMEGSSFIAIAPFASLVPFEIMIVPRDHRPDFGSITEAQVGELSQMIRTVLKKLALSLGRPPYNMIISTAPVNTGNGEPIHFHWHTEILPRLTIAAGYELGTGNYINPTPPEMAAEELRNAAPAYNENIP